MKVAWVKAVEDAIMILALAVLGGAMTGLAAMAMTGPNVPFILLGGLLAGTGGFYDLGRRAGTERLGRALRAAALAWPAASLLAVLAFLPFILGSKGRPVVIPLISICLLEVLFMMAAGTGLSFLSARPVQGAGLDRDEDPLLDRPRPPAERPARRRLVYSGLALLVIAGGAALLLRSNLEVRSQKLTALRDMETIYVLRSLVLAQENYYAQFGLYASDVAGLRARGFSHRDFIDLSIIRAGGHSWAGTAKSRYSSTVILYDSAKDEYKYIRGDKAETRPAYTRGRDKP